MHQSHCGCGCRIRKPHRLRPWRWKELPVYEGFTHEERVRAWQLVSVMIDAGKMPKATTCCISGETHGVGYRFGELL